MPEKRTIERAQRAKRKGKSASTQASEFVREEIHHVREGKHGARSTKQAIAIGLSKARRAGVDLPPPSKGKTSEKTHRSAERAHEAGQKGERKVSARRSRAAKDALRREGRSAASARALSRHSRSTAQSRAAASRSKAARTRGPAGRSAAARKTASTRAAGAAGR